MEPSSHSPSSSPPQAPASLRQPFIATANALTALYKTAATNEQAARAAGERAAYSALLEWATRRARAGSTLSAADVVAFASARLASAGGHPNADNAHANAGGNYNRGTTAAGLPAGPPPPPRAAATTSSAIVHHGETRDGSRDALASKIGELRVNPRKRQRTEFGDALLQIWHEEAAARGGDGEDDCASFDGEDAAEAAEDGDGVGEGDGGGGGGGVGGERARIIAATGSERAAVRKIAAKRAAAAAAGKEWAGRR